MDANTSYVIELFVHYHYNGTSGITFGISGPASPTVVRSSYDFGDATHTHGYDTFYTSGLSITTIADGFIKFNVTVQNGSNAGYFSFQWAQQTSSANTTVVYKGSYLKYSKV